MMENKMTELTNENLQPQPPTQEQVIANMGAELERLRRVEQAFKEHLETEIRDRLVSASPQPPTDEQYLKLGQALTNLYICNRELPPMLQDSRTGDFLRREMERFFAPAPAQEPRPANQIAPDYCEKHDKVHKCKDVISAAQLVENGSRCRHCGQLCDTNKPKYHVDYRYDGHDAEPISGGASTSLYSEQELKDQGLQASTINYGAEGSATMYSSVGGASTGEQPRYTEAESTIALVNWRSGMEEAAQLIESICQGTECEHSKKYAELIRKRITRTAPAERPSGPSAPKVEPCFRGCTATTDRKLCADNSGLMITWCGCECHESMETASAPQPDCDCGAGNDAYLGRHAKTCALYLWAEPKCPHCGKGPTAAPSVAGTQPTYTSVREWLEDWLEGQIKQGFKPPMEDIYHNWMRAAILAFVESGAAPGTPQVEEIAREMVAAERDWRNVSGHYGTLKSLADVFSEILAKHLPGAPAQLGPKEKNGTQ